MKRIIAAIAFSLGLFSAVAQNDVLITEFMASNDSTVADEDGDFSDWIEIYNAGTNTVNLSGWKLADRNNVWDFPATNIAPNTFMIVFASNKNRRIAGRTLHTNFRLDASPAEQVSLLRPDSSVASQYTPPPQAEDISYGIPINVLPVTLVATGAPAKFSVPADDSGGSAWTQHGFDDSVWTTVQNGVGYEADPVVANTATVIADSAAEFGSAQGANNWYYGYWNKRDDANATYEPGEFVEFPRGTGDTLNGTNYWNGTSWNWPPPADPPWTELTRTGGHPAGANGSPTDPIHWTIRRYVSENAGQLRLSGTLAASGSGGNCGDGTIGRIFVDGVEVFQRTVFNLSIGYSVLVNANVGSTIDFVIDSGTTDNDFCDTTTFTATIRAVSDLGLVAETIGDWSDTGVQGYKGWTYGAFIRTNASLAYAANRFGTFPSGSGPHSADNFWNGESWQWFDGDPPFDRISQYTAQPNIFPSTSTTNAFEHWVIRRWVSEIAGTLHIDWHLGKQDLTGGGATARLYRNGTAVAGAAMTVTGVDFAGSNRTDVIQNVQIGDVIDFAIEPGADIVGDLCFFNATIHGFTTLSNHFRSDVRTAMQNVNSSAYLRIPFTIDNALAFNSLTLRVKSDDGFNAYVNGQLVASRNAPEPSTWNSAATASRVDAESAQFEEFDLFQLAEDVLRSGDNVLAIQGLNSSAADADFLVVAELHASITSLDRSSPNYFYAPTPGTANGLGSSTLGPIISEVSHTPHEPADDEDLFVTARILPVLHAVAPSGVRVYYRVQFGAEASVVMQDDGENWDGAAGDGVYGGRIPHTVAGPGQMLRYYVTATDTNNALMRQPPFPHSQFSSQYFGTVVKNAALTNPLPVMHLFITDANLASANNNQAGRFACSIYFLGEFYDNLGLNRHGQSSQGFPKRSYDIDFNADHAFRWDPNQDRVDDINLLSTYPDKSHMRNLIAYDTLRDAGAPYHFVIPVRVETNGGFFGDWHMMENGDDRFLKRVGRDPKGALYKMYNTFTDVSDYTLSSSEAEKKTRREEGNADLQALFNGVNVGTLQQKTNYMYDNINIAATINTFAARALTSEHDCCHKNYYFYRDSDITGEWEGFAWDMDLSFGRNWQSAETYYDDRVYTQNRVWGNWDNNNFFRLVLNQPLGSGNPATREMYLRRARTLADELQQTNGTPYEMLYYEQRIDQYAAQIAPDAAMDLPKWGTWGGGATAIFATNNQYYRPLPQSVAELKTNYMVNRRAHVFNNRWGLGAEFPDPQPTNVTIQIGAIEYNPSSGNQQEEYIRLVNPNNIAVDISHWKLAGAIEHTFQGGVVLPRNGGSVYVVPNKKAFRARATAPRGGMGLFVEGAYRGQLSARGETIYLVHKQGHLVSSNQYSGNPTPAQNSLRVTEIMYHPTVPTFGPFGPEEYEYIELRNIGATPLNLNGVRFVSGIEFTFGNMILAPGAYVLVVKNVAAFELGYGVGFNVAGQYIGSLDNGGERIEIQDAVGEKVQDFNYNNSWYPITDGAGASLVIINDQAPWDSWGMKASWRPSTYDGGTPAAGDPPAIAVVPVLVNEVLSHTELPEVDRIELRNTNAVVADISGWFISDDFEEPKKFRIPDGTVIAAGEYITFDESHFNDPLSATSFAFSSLGDEAYLFSGNGTNLTGYFHGFEIGAADNGVSFMRYLDSRTNEHFVASSNNTFNLPNSYPRVGPVVISEIMYHPPEYGDGADTSVEEFVEIHNLTAETVNLYDVDAPENTWRMRGGVDFNFPTNQSLAPGAFALLVSFNTTNTPVLNAFRSRYNLSPSVAIYGPYEGALNNAGDSVRLLKPGTPVLDDLGSFVVPYVQVDAVDYSPIEPWPLAADGIGASLQRKVLSEFGNDPVNWAGGLSPGANFGGTPPSITGQSGHQTTVAGRTLTISATVIGTDPLIYQWQLNGQNIQGANSATLTMIDIRPDQAGAYKLVVFNSAGSAESGTINVTVQIPPRITRHPQPIGVQVTSNATFTVIADSVNTSTLIYQWMFNGSPIQDATNASYTILGAQLSDDGFYSVSVTDPVDTVISQAARLAVLVQPLFVQMPISQFVPQGGSVTVSVTVTNTATQPLTYRWRRIGGGGVTNIEVYSVTDFLTLTNVQGSNRYDVIVFNQAQPNGRQSTPPFFVAAIPDADGDGLPDQWETDNGVTDPDGDADGDTMTNLAEYIAGTNPNDGQSYLKVEKLNLGAGAAIEFIARSNRTYTVEATDDLRGGIWSPVRDIYATSNAGPVSVVDPAFTPTRFYRLATPKKR